MSLLTRIRTNTVLKKIAQRVEKKLKRRLTALLWKFLKQPKPTDADSLDGIESILLIRPNYRLGNALIGAPAIAAFRKRFPSARIDFLATDTTLALFENQPVDRFFTLSRRAIARPWLFVALLKRLRGEKYDLAVQIGSGSLTGCLFARLIDARYSMGMSRKGQRWFDVEVSGKSRHAYDTPLVLARALNVPCRNRPLLCLIPSERTKALGLLGQHSIAVDADGDATPFVAVFVGGHLDKRCSLAFWLEVLRTLESAGIRHVVFLGPEERKLAPALQGQLAASNHGTLCHPRPLREFAAMLAHATLLVTPDSGPMHLAAALDVPAITIMQTKKSAKFAPREYLDTTLWKPSAEQVLLAIEETRMRRHERDFAAQALPRLATG